MVLICCFALPLTAIPVANTHYSLFPFSFPLDVSFCILETWLLKSVPWVLGQASTPGQYSQIYFVLISCSLQVLSWTWECMPAKDKDKLQRKHLHGSTVLQNMFFPRPSWYGQSGGSVGPFWRKLSRRFMGFDWMSWWLYWVSGATRQRGQGGPIWMACTRLVHHNSQQSALRGDKLEK